MNDVTQSDKEFLEACAPKLKQLEKLRLVKIKSYEWRKKIASIASPVIFPICGFIDYWLIILQQGNDEMIAGLTVGVAIGLYSWVTQPKRQYTKQYKIDILPKIAKLFGNLTYELKTKIDMEKIKPSSIIPDYTKYTSEDYFSGHYRNISLEFSEIELVKRKGYGKNSRDVTVFKGLAILLNADKKKFYGHTIIERNVSRVSEWLKEKNLGLKRANLVDPEFEKRFDVFTNDQVEARYLIHPTMIEKLTSIYDEYHGNSLQAAYYNDKMLILIGSTHNHFEPGDIYIPAADTKSMLHMKHEVEKIMSIIDQLELYEPQSAHLPM